MVHVLVVEDEAPIRQLVARILSGLSHTIDEAEDGAEALAQLARRRPDVILLDLTLPVLDGISFLRRCRETPELADIRVVVMSGLAEGATPAAELGVRHFLRKPFELDDLIDAIEESTVRVG